ncbi:MAG: DUF4139 domain-containing protein [Deltaproteobacteria bacterium]|nr:DUF4139 domain-containing protein [Deltaproteobacteria bacterium]MBW2070821.1 DUF4139 domain-containing protein [Deltaproteobacteria bacterium]
MKGIIFTTVVIIALCCPSWAKVDLVTLPGRDSVQLTIYNSADLTLVRERRVLTLKKGLNELQFSWANTLIDPTSLEMVLRSHADRIDVLDLTYPPRIQNLGLWHIRSGISGKVPVEIVYLTSGLTWRAFYLGTLAKDEASMELQAFVRVSNHSGEDYEKAQTRVIVGRVHLLEQIARLARQRYPYGRPGIAAPRPEMLAGKKARMAFEEAEARAIPAALPKKIEKEAISEYYLYTIEGRESIADGWSKRLPSFTAARVAVTNLYKFDEERYGAGVVRFLKFKNDREHGLGFTTIPGGVLKVYRQVGETSHLTYEGQSRFKYVPIGEDVELNLGRVETVMVEPKLMHYETRNYLFDNKGNVSGWDEVRRFTVLLKNTRNVAVGVEVWRNFSTSNWDIEVTGDYDHYQKVDLDTVKFTVQLPANSSKKFSYRLTSHHGTRAE